LFIIRHLLTTTWCLIIFTVLTSSLYLINDIADLPKDQLHPFKKNRPIASGELPVILAFFAALAGLLIAFYLSFLHNRFFFLTALAYFVLQISYTLWLKNIIVLDVLAIASGFILRVYAGAFAINVHMSVWFLLCVVSLSLFLAVGKRRAELGILTDKVAPRTRKTLTFYTQPLLDSYLSMFANSTWLAYALFTFFTSPPLVGKRLSFLADFPLTLAGINKWLMISVPIVVYGVMRYMNIIYQGNRAEVPEQVLLSDRPLLWTVFIWGVLIILIIYGIRG
jgi:4-hydroxybenzoate polyprenyltransferase